MTAALALEQQSRTLSPEQIEDFSRDGFIVIRQLFAAEEVDTIREAFMAQADQGPIPHLFDQKPELASVDPLARYPRMMHPHRYPDLEIGRLSMQYMLDERYRAVLRDLYGEEPMAAQSMFYFKPAGARGQSLHQDNFYLRVQPGTCMAAWLSIDDADEENGTLVVVPGSHKQAIACPEKADPSISFTTEYVPVPFGLDEHVVILKAGDVLFFNGSLIHGSYPNASKDRFRRSFICHYAPESCKEISGGYKLLEFSGAAVEREAATGGGPCGTDAGPVGFH